LALVIRVLLLAATPVSAEEIQDKRRVCLYMRLHVCTYVYARDGRPTWVSPWLDPGVVRER